MKRNIFLFALIIIFITSYWLTTSIIYESKPDAIIDLEYEQKQVNEKYITAQILSQSLNRVYDLFDKNMASKASDSKNETASMPFLNSLTDVMNRLELKVLEIKPDKKEKKGKYTRIPYDLEFECDFTKLGKFVTELESNERIIIIDEFTMKNGIERLNSSRSKDQLQNQLIKMRIYTVTLNKNRG